MRWNKGATPVPPIAKRRNRKQPQGESHVQKREELPGQSEDESGKDNSRQIEARTGPQAEEPAEQCGRVMLERIVVVEALIRQPVIERREPRAYKVI